MSHVFKQLWLVAQSKGQYKGTISVLEHTNHVGKVGHNFIFVNEDFACVITSE